MKLTALPLPVGEDVPDGYCFVEAYTNGKEIVIPGEPDEDDNHDCDLMGCSTFGHVAYRIQLKTEEP